MSNKVLNAYYGSNKTPLRLGDIEIPCYVLEDGTRVLSRSGIQKAIGYTGQSGEMLTRLVTEKQGFSPTVVAGVSDPIRFNRVDAGGSQPITNGTEATIFIDICNTLIDLKRAGVLTPRQEIYAVKADIIVRASAKVGIIALIDEATGYQVFRGRTELQDYYSKFFKEEAGKWIKRFPDEFFKLMFEMKGWTWNYASTKKPGIVGKYINDIIYARIAPGILQELRRINPPNEKGQRKTKHHVWFTDSIGHPKLQEHFAAVLALMKASGNNWGGFLRLLNRSLPKFGYIQTELDLPEKED